MIELDSDKTADQIKGRCVRNQECCNCGNPLHKRNLGIAVFLRPDKTEHAICGDCKVPAVQLDCMHRDQEN